MRHWTHYRQEEIENRYKKPTVEPSLFYYQLMVHMHLTDSITWFILFEDMRGRR